MPIVQTIVLLVPSVEVTKGDPQPTEVRFTLHLWTMSGGLLAVMLKVESSYWLARQDTYVRWLVRYVAAAWMIA